MNELTTQTKTVSMMSAQKSYIKSIGSGMEDLLGKTTNYQALCGYNMLNAINTLLAKEGLDHRSDKVDKTSINDAIKFAMVYQLNTDNKEVFVIIRNSKNKDGSWIKKVECKPQYKGQLKIIATYGRNVDKVYPEWIVLDTDDFTYPMMKGLEVVPPTWTKKGEEGKTRLVVVPIKYKDGFVDFRIAERESVATNIKAQIKQSLQNNKDYSDDEAKRLIALAKDMNLEQLLNDPSLSSLINETYKGISSEEMIITKLVINATKRVAIEYSSALSRELLEKTYDNADVYTPSHKADELAQNEAKQIEVKEVEEVGEEKSHEPKEVEVVEETGEVVPPTESDLASFLGE